MPGSLLTNFTNCLLQLPLSLGTSGGCGTASVVQAEQLLQHQLREQDSCTWMGACRDEEPGRLQKLLGGI